MALCSMEAEVQRLVHEEEVDPGAAWDMVFAPRPWVEPNPLEDEDAPSD